MLGTSLDLALTLRKMLIMVGLLIPTILFAFVVRKNRKYLKYFIGFAIFVNLLYILWRIGFTLPTMNLIALFFGLLLLLAEVFAFIQTTTHRLMFLKPFEPELKTLADLDELPTVDILIATYNEPVSILKNTIAGATSQTYPQSRYTVYVCDDGCRQEVKALAESYGAVWSVRDEHVHAKAGNLNHCLEQYARGEFFAVLDADMIPKSTFLEKTIGYFSDPKMALVQAPQVFYNPDPFQNNLQLYQAIPNEQDFFMREVMTRRAIFNAVLNVGSNAVFRRSAVEAIGRIPVGTITEDMATSMILQSKGYHSTFVNETLAMGLSPDSFSDYIVQRDRWARGNIQVMKKWNPLTMPGLNFMQRLIYFDGVLYWFFGLQKLIYFLGPILFLFTGIPVVYVDVFTMLMFFIPFYYVSSLVFALLSHKSRTYVWAHIYESALAPYLAVSALSELLFSKDIRFAVTPKGAQQEKSRFAFRVALPHMVLGILSMIALGLGINKMLTDVNYMIPVYLVNIFWLLYNFLGAITALFACFENKRVRTVERFVIKDNPVLTLENGRRIATRLEDISLDGCALILDDPLEDADQFVGETVRVSVGKNQLKLEGHFYRSRSWGKKIIIIFDELTLIQHSHLINFIIDHQDSGYGRFNIKRENFIHTFKEIIKKWFRRSKVTQ
jgi:cellulose synthase (UDP-forming)